MSKVMKYLLLFLTFLPFAGNAQHVFQSDFQNFWIMRDSVMSIKEPDKQLDGVNRLYIDKASDGLKAFMRNKEGLDHKWLDLIKEYPSFWDSLKMKTPLIQNSVKRLEEQIGHFQELYPELIPAQTYFIIGIRQQGGTVRANLSLLGVEVVLADPSTNDDQLVRMGVHEYVHTQQKRPDFQKINVLTSSIREGACDFLSFIVTGIPVQAPYMAYGQTHERAVWLLFQKEMNTNHNDNWVSTGRNPALPAPDLGYFVGYRICETFYNKANDKKAAIKELVNLNYADSNAVNDFLLRSGYDGK